MLPFAAALVRRASLTAILAAVLLVTVLASAFDFVLRDRQTVREASLTAQANLALGLERDILRNLDIYDLTLRAAAKGLRLVDGSMNVAAQNAILFDGAGAAQYFRSVLVANRDGTVLHDSGALTPRIANVSDRPFFAAHRDRDDLGLLVLLNTRSGIDGKPYLSMSRRVNTPGGQFDGTVAGGLDLGYFQEIFSRYALPKGGAIALVGYDGRLVAGFPFRENAIGQDVSGAGLVARARQDNTADFETRSVVDGITRLATVRRLGTLPFFIAVGTPLEAVYAPWHERARVVVAVMFTFAAAFIFLLAALARELRRRRVAEQNTLDASEAVRVSERQLGIYFDHLADGILAIRKRPDGHFIYERVNSAASRMLGLKPHETIGRRPIEILPGPLAARVEERFQRCASEKITLRYDQTLDGPAGARVIRFVLAPVREPNDTDTTPVTLLLSSLRDVTETVDTEARLRQAQRMEAVGQLTAGVAHDFNNMLQAQLGALEILLNEVKNMPHARACAELAIAAGTRGASLTNSLLSFSRQQHLAPRPVPIGPLLQRLQQMSARTLGPRIEIRLQFQEGVAEPFVDMAQLEAAVLNLLLNARDAMPEGGIIRVEARNATAADIAAEGLTMEQAVMLAVSDTGCGMTPEVAARACEPFFSTKGVGQGSGLGLSMVQGFVQQSGGAIRIASAPRQGTRVTIWLPQAAETAAATTSAAPALPEPPPPRQRTEGDGRRILLVDDEPDVLAVTAELLEDRGFQVVQAARGAEALTLLETTQAFDVLVTDYMMPGINGGELIRRAVQIFPDLPTLIVTGYAESEVLRGLPPHVEVVRKPMRVDVLAQRLCAILARARASSDQSGSPVG